MNPLTDEAIEEYQDIWEKHYGRVIDKDVARQEAKRLLDFMRPILEHQLSDSQN